MLLTQMIKDEPAVEIQYSRVATVAGNPAALRLMTDVFEETDAEWRGLGRIPRSGLRIKAGYAMFDAEKKFHVTVEPTRENTGCRCGEVMQGTVRPPECPLFGSTCTPENPVGSCMVSTEGTCAAWYTYEMR
jgi:hydrogenase expression/formation protein HypD